MKKSILFTLLFLVTTLTVTAQKSEEEKVMERVNTFVEALENNAEVTEEEKSVYIEAKKAQVITYRKNWKELKDDKEAMNAKNKEANMTFQQTLIDALGKKRAYELVRAGNNKS